MYKQNVCQCVIWECKGCRHNKEDREEARAGEWVREKERERERERERGGRERERGMRERGFALVSYKNWHGFCEERQRIGIFW